MPLIVTDSDVLAQIAIDDGLAASLETQVEALGARVPPAVLAAWNADAAAYAAWSGITKSALSGGFLMGAWFGVPEMGNQAVAWGLKFAHGAPAGSPGGATIGWQTILDAIGKGQAPPAMAAGMVSSDAVATMNATNAAPALLDSSTKVLIGAGLALGLLIILKR